MVQKMQKKQEQMIVAFDSEKRVQQKKSDDQKMNFNKTK